MGLKPRKRCRDELSKVKVFLEPQIFTEKKLRTQKRKKVIFSLFSFCIEKKAKTHTHIYILMLCSFKMYEQTKKRTLFFTLLWLGSTLEVKKLQLISSLFFFDLNAS